MSIASSSTPDLALTRPRRALPADAEFMVASYERRYSLSFDTITTLPASTLAHLATDNPRSADWVDVSLQDDEIAKHIAVLTEVANSSSPSDTERAAYRKSLLSIFRHMGIAEARRTRQWALWVAPEREGRELAVALGCVPSRNFRTPHAKRIPADQGLRVGLSWGGEISQNEECVIIDGAIASGSTLVAILDTLKHTTGRFTIYAAHATNEGLRVLSGFASAFNIRISVVIGHVSGVLNGKAYAVTDGTSNRLVVGDVGDILCGKVN